jgi:hypothetical protein
VAARRVGHGVLRIIDIVVHLVMLHGLAMLLSIHFRVSNRSEVVKRETRRTIDGVESGLMVVRAKLDERVCL